MSELHDFCDRAWRGEVDSRFDVPWRERQAEELEPGVLYYKGVSSATTIDTGDGLVMLDTGHTLDIEPLHREVRQWRAETPLVAAIYSHHHVDHVSGIAAFDDEARLKGLQGPVVYGHEGVGGNFDRYRKTARWNGIINRRQFHNPSYAVDEPLPFPTSFRYPDVTYRDQTILEAGNLALHLQHCRGETDDCTWTWVPQRGLLFTGDLFIWVMPNAGNPQKVQRYVGEWAAGLREMASLRAETMVPGHGFPIIGADRVRTALTEGADFLEDVEEQVLSLMNGGASLDETLHGVTFDKTLLAKPYLKPVYDHEQFLIRSIWRLYGGWYDGQPDNLLPAPREQQAREWVALAGGLDKVLARAEALLNSGDLRMACHLVEQAVIASPESKAAHELRALTYEARAKEETASMSRNLFLYAAQSSRHQRADGFR
jgi:alkyl sulfatase BDS1-like metallo-beta-lactamase superfamily hydrolase